MTAPRKSAAQVEEIAVWQLEMSARETRKTLDQGALRELAASIELHGVQEPLLVRLMRAVDGEPDGLLYEIVAGQRRCEAAKMAGLKVVPCLVRVMSDAEAEEARVVSNLQREDLPPLEEAMAFRSLLLAEGATIESVAERLAKTPSHISRRLKLLDAIEPVREALRCGAIEVGHALELARLGEDQQVDLLVWLGVLNERPDAAPDEDEDESQRGFPSGMTSDVGGDAEAATPPRFSTTMRSVAELRKRIGDTTLRVLADAPFPLDAEMPPVACVDCPKRTGNASLLFEDCAQDTCTDRACYDAKLKVWVKAELQAADKEKRSLLMLSDYGHDGCLPGWGVTVLKAGDACQHAEAAIWIDGDKMGHRAMLCRAKECEKHARNSYGAPVSAEDSAKKKAERKKLLAKVKAEKLYREALFRALAAAPVPYGASGDFYIATCEFAIRRANVQRPAMLAEALGWEKDVFAYDAKRSLEQALKGMDPMHRARAALLAIHSGELHVYEHSVGSKPKNLEEMAALLKIDAKKVRVDAEIVELAKQPKTKKDPAQMAGAATRRLPSGVTTKKKTAQNAAGSGARLTPEQKAAAKRMVAAYKEERKAIAAKAAKAAKPEAKKAAKPVAKKRGFPSGMTTKKK